MSTRDPTREAPVQASHSGGGAPPSELACYERALFGPFDDLVPAPQSHAERRHRRPESRTPVQRRIVLRIPLPQRTAGDSAPVQQRRGGGDVPAPVIRQAAREGVETPSTELPFADRIQRSFGRHDIGRIQAHLGPEASAAAASMNASAYATGEHVVFAGTPSIETVAHEAAHVVQQRAGVQLGGGIGKAGDAHERHADAVAARVATGQSAADLLDRYAEPQQEGHAAGVQRMSGSASGGMIQRLTESEARDSLKTRGMKLIEFSDEADEDGHFSTASVTRKGTYKALLDGVRDFYISPGQDFIWYTTIEHFLHPEELEKTSERIFIEVHVPADKDDDPASHHYVLRDGHHRFIASEMTGRTIKIDVRFMRRAPDSIFTWRDIQVAYKKDKARVEAVRRRQGKQELDDELEEGGDTICLVQ